jgi:DUF4097 and DUF4098 domain-containing protein YvlB
MRSVSLLGVASLLLASLAVADVKETEEFTFDINPGGRISLENINGDIQMDKVSTVNGDIEIRTMSGNVKAETVNGDLVASGLVADVDLETVNGGVNAEFDSLGSGQRVSAEAVNGRIVLELPADTSARVHAETVNGSIDADDFNLVVDKGFVGRECDGQIGDGDARISLDTVNGSIRIVKR